MRQGQRGGLALDAGVVEDLLGPLVSGIGGAVDRHQVRAGDVQVDAAGAAVVAGNDGALGREGAHARELFVEPGDLVHQGLDMPRVQGLGDDPDPGGRYLHVEIGHGRHAGFARGVGLAVRVHVGQEVVFHLAGNGFHLLQVVTRRRRHGGKGLGLLAFRQVFGGWGQHKNHPQAEADGGCHHQKPAHRAIHQPSHRPHGGPAPATRGFVAVFIGGHAPAAEIQPGTEGGYDGDCHQHGGENGSRDGNGHVGIQLARLFLDKQDRQEHQDGCGGGRQHRRPDFTHALEGRFETVQPQTPVSLDVLKHHDAVVHRHADGKGDTGQRDHVDGAAGDQQPDKRGYGTQRYAHHPGKRGPAGPQKQEHHQGCEGGTDTQIGPDIGNRGFHVPGIVCGQAQGHARRFQHFAVDGGDFVHHGVLDIDNVGSALPTHLQADHPLAIDDGQFPNP